MRTLRCQCGKAVAYTSMSFRDCQGCEECKTTYSGHPGGHRELQLHDYQPWYDPHTGEQVGEECARCGNYKPLADEALV